MQSIHINLPDNTPDGRRFWVEKDCFNLDHKGRPVPYFSFREVSAFFFGRGREWLHYQVYSGNKEWSLDGVPFEFTFDTSGRRVMTLADVERLAHAMFQSDPKFDILRLATVVNLVKYVALAHGYLNIQGYPVPPEDIKRAWKNTNKKRFGK